ncbi:predicted protein [Nematostella vectensis]|uniref:X-box-binding protein 1 n=1 Tax=Nematostella vectensis TaxID=45351 RepID=A7SF27_NEMVE|nr:X-box-binding protein 1 [Nematostella vectensis]EDO37681.1 predicted protein [Nematostella vectensis]|eukprot:XP_001629744.1 predicted protein [Nematostella vectensis]
MEAPNINRDAVLKSLLLNETNPDGQPRKRRRLDNLTVEERALRRKLKNRVAAQTARDRKKARMQDLEEAVESLERENKRLREENKRLNKSTESLAIENSELRVRLGLTPPVSPVSSLSSSTPPSPASERSDSAPEGWAVIKTEAESKESAALIASQQQKNLILFLSVITTWLQMNCSLSCLLVCLKMLSPVTMNSFNQSRKTSLPVAELSRADQSKSSLSETKKLSRSLPDSMTWWGKHQNTWNPLMRS